MDSKGRNYKRKLKNQIFSFRMTMWNEPKGGIVLQTKENCQADFAWTCENFSHSCKMPQEAIIVAAEFLISSSCEKDILLLNFRLLDEEASGRPLRWCQMSTWPCPINRNLNPSCKREMMRKLCEHFLIVEFSRFSLSIEFFIFSLFLISQTCLVRPNLQVWVAKPHFSWRNEDLEARSMVN